MESVQDRQAKARSWLISQGILHPSSSPKKLKFITQQMDRPSITAYITQQVDMPSITASKKTIGDSTNPLLSWNIRANLLVALLVGLMIGFCARELILLYVSYVV